MVMVSNKLYGRMVTALKLFFATVAVLCVVAAAPAMAAGKRVALIIGNSAYVNGNNLPNPMNDAGVVAQTARKAGFEIMQANDLAVVSFHQKLREFRDKADSAEVAMIYYAGHGIDNNGENWLIPTDVHLADPRDLQTEAISLSEVLSSVAGAKLRIVLLDACRNNPFGDKWTSLSRAIQPGLSRIDATEGSLVIFAADPGSTILDDGAGGNSYFAKAIANRLAEPGLQLQMLGNKIYDDVRTASGGKQRPFPTQRLTGMDFFLVPKPEDPGARMDSDDATFLRAQQVNTAAAYLDYVNKFPTGKSALIATSLYSALSRAVPARPQQSATVSASDSPAQQALPPTREPVQIVPPPQAAYVPPTNSPVIVGPTSQNPADTPAPPVTAPVQTGYIMPPAPSKIEGPTVQNPAPAPTPPIPQIVSTPQKDNPLTVSPVPVVAQATAQSATYVAPPIARQYGNGGFPVMPEPPVFDYGPYPRCKDNWSSIQQPMERVNATIACGNAFTDYQTNWLNKYREAMNAYGFLVGEIYTKEVAPPRFPNNAAEQDFFYKEMDRRVNGVKDGGYLMVDYEKAKARFKADSDAVKDTYNRATGCKGYPTPTGLAANPSCG